MSEQEHKTAAELEKELTERRHEESEKAEEQKDESKKLGISKLNKTNKGRTILISILLLALLVATAYYLLPVLGKMTAEKEDTKQTQQTDGRLSGKRTDLGQAIDPFPATSQKTDTGATDNKETDNRPVTQEKPVFSRALAKPLYVNSSNSNGGNSSQQNNQNNAETNTTTEISENTDNRQNNSESQAPVLTKITKVPYDPNLFIPENTPIQCSLDRYFISTLSGKLTCTINHDVYSANNNVKLIEKGTVAHLLYKSGTLKHGQGRVFIMATKLRTGSVPFIDIPLLDTQASGELGEMGVNGWIDTHFWDRFGGAMMLGIIPDAALGLSDSVKNNKDNQTDYTANSRQAFSEIAKSAFENSVGIPPTMYKNQGEIITLIIGQDLDFSSIYRLKLKGKNNVR